MKLKLECDFIHSTLTAGNSMKIEIIEEERQWVVVNKPAGLATHANSDKDPNLVDELSKGGKRVHAVHRLDRETSGIVMLAKSSIVAADLMKLWTTDKVTKHYEALLQGKLTKSVEPLIWDWDLSDRAEGGADPQGPKALRKTAKTLCTVLEVGQKSTHVLCEILTGRTHQIRRHAALARHPILGDKRYNPKAVKGSRMALHASYLQIVWQGLRMEWSCPPPADFMTSVGADAGETKAPEKKPTR